ncbi:M20 family metallopeptidase [Elongatibacter sediminis]|uniref:M20 family metallopeptidase n=1 Tax=Elongatibacter sediminis TaxID=3119006 RepID=A0AAW9RDD8_9GAMM
MDQQALQQFVDEKWNDEIVPELVEYIKIPNKSPHFDPDWDEHGYMEDAVNQIFNWCKAQDLPGMTAEVVRLEGRTPLIFMEIPGQGDSVDDDTILLYGHLDKQPEMTGWADDLGPWKPVIKDEKLYGRGGADDGYAAYGSLTAIMAVQREQRPHARCVVIIEACEESGSYDLPHYIDHLMDRIGTPSLVICLDSGAGNYEQLWLTVSLRGMTAGELRADVLGEGVHSGYASGVVPSSFRVLRRLISRLEDETTGEILPDFLHAEIPQQRIEQVQRMAEALGDEIYTPYPFVDGVGPMGSDNVDRILNRTWRPALSVTGADGLPSLESAGNVLRPHTSLKLSMRLPPTVDGEEATRKMKETLESDPPYGARVNFEPDHAATGWNAPDVAPWLHESLERASQAAYGKGVMYMGEGGTIPFMAMLGDAFPEAQFMITGVLGPNSNAHGPNEFLHVPFARKLTSCVAQVIADHYQRRNG